MQASSQDIRILYVDDHEDNLLTLSHMLRGEPYALDLALAADDAFRYLLENSYSCILCDVRMPEMDGYALVELIRQDPKHAETPVVFITGHDSAVQKQRAFELGAVDYITKPVDPITLRSKLAVFAALWRRTREVERQQQLFEATMNELEEGLVVLGSDAQVIYTNQRMRELWGEPITAIQQLAELPLLSAKGRTQLKGRDNPFCSALLGHNHREVEVVIPSTAANVEAIWSVSVRAVADAAGVGGAHPRVALIVRDITARKLAEEALSRRNVALEQYAYVASHDLKAPLRHISAFSEMLDTQLQSHPDPQVHQSLHFIHRATRTMRDLIDGLLALSTLGADGLVLERVNLAELFRGVWELELAPQPEDARLILEEPLPEWMVDIVSFRQVFANLLGNAVKFRRLDIPLEIRVSTAGAAPNQELIISDNGIGIPMGQAERIFRAFQRLNSRERYEGSGLGLTLCRKVVEMHGGQIFTKQSQQPGAAFVIRLPSRPDATPQ
jgi:signal transduction histidine kinase